MFKVIEPARVTDGPMATRPGVGNYGAFSAASVEPGWTLWLVCDDGTDPDVEGEWRGWEHVSVSARRGDKVRTPTWKEMCQVKALHWDDEDVVVQFHPRRSEYVNLHPYVLHLWRHVSRPFPTPPPGMVGPLS